jgi:hypothetical protein
MTVRLGKFFSIIVAKPARGLNSREEMRKIRIALVGLIREKRIEEVQVSLAKHKASLIGLIYEIR